MRKLSLILLTLVLPSCGIGLCADTACTSSVSPAPASSLLTLRSVQLDAGKILVSWSPIVGASGPVTYSVFMVTADGTSSLVATTDQAEYEVTGLTIDQDFTFRVTASYDGQEFEYDSRSPFCGGTGTASDEYLICDAGSLQYLALHLSSSAKIVADIDLTDTVNWNSGSGFKPIGENTGNLMFQGSLNGSSKTLSNLFISRSGYVGLFGSLGKTSGVQATASYLTLRNFKITSTGLGSAGALAGALPKAIVHSVHTSGFVQSTASGGGLSGEAYISTVITDCSSSAYVRCGGLGCGGLVGYFAPNPGNIISRSFATGDVSSTGQGAGGLVGYAGQVTISDSYATGNARSTVWYVGGLVGDGPGAGLTVIRSYATGNVSSAIATNVGGLIGRGGTSTISYSFSTGLVHNGVGGMIGDARAPSNSYWLTHSLNPANCYSGGNAGCTSVTNLTYFYNLANYGGGALNWDFGASGNWIMSPDGKYPVLRWQYPDPSITFAAEFRNGRKIGPTDASSYRVWGYCTTPGSTISFGGPNAPTSTSCLGGTWSTTWNFSGSGDGNIDITVQENNSAVAQRRLVKDTAECTAGLIAEVGAGAIDGRFAAPYTNGSYHVVCNVEQMARLQANTSNWTKAFVLGANIDMNPGYTNLPIGTNVTPFTGSFDGKSFVLSELTLNLGTGISYGALFGYVSAGGTVTRVGVEDVFVSCGYYCAGVVGRLTGSAAAASHLYSTGYVIGDGGVGGVVGRNTSAVTDSFSRAEVFANLDGSGGLVGYGEADISRSYALGNVRGAYITGGLAGQLSGGTASQCYAGGRVAGSMAYGSGAIGGLVGELDVGTVSDSYSTSNVFGVGYAGGLVGAVFSSGNILRSYASGSAFGNSHLGGILGYDSTALTEKVFSTATVTATTSNGGQMIGYSNGSTSLTDGYWWSLTPDICVGDSGTAVSCTQALDRSQFESNNGAPLTSFDFNSVWKFPAAGGLPILEWQSED